VTYTIKVVEDETERAVTVVPGLPLVACGMLIELWTSLLKDVGCKVNLIEVDDKDGKGITREDVRLGMEKGGLSN
jgi:hypothetical protein